MSLNASEQQFHPPEEVVSKEFDREAAIRSIADQLVSYSLEVEAGDVVWIRFETMTGELARLVCEQIDAIPGARSLLSFSDDSLEKTMLESVGRGAFVQGSPVSELHVGDHTLTSPTQENSTLQDQSDYLFSGPVADQEHFLKKCTKVLLLASRKNLQGYKTDADVEKAFAIMSKPLTTIRVHERRWCLYRPPSPLEAQAADLPFEKYEQLYYEACNRPWAEVEKAQDILVNTLEEAHRIRIAVPSPPGMDPVRWHTDVEMGINSKRKDQPNVHTFVNSVAKRNMPGSEVFTGPDAGTLNGRYALPYSVMLKDRVVPNLILIFKDGKVDSFDTDGTAEDREHIKRILETDAGSSIVGELGIGTNPVVNFPVLNTMLNEKILGIHLALGSAYTYKQYLGTPVDIDNGNASSIHIDLSRVMSPAYGGGQIILTKYGDTGEEVQEVIFDNGQFLDPRLAILNGNPGDTLRNIA